MSEMALVKCPYCHQSIFEGVEYISLDNHHIFFCDEHCCHQWLKDQEKDLK